MLCLVINKYILKKKKVEALFKKDSVECKIDSRKKKTQTNNQTTNYVLMAAFVVICFEMFHFASKNE